MGCVLLLLMMRWVGGESLLMLLMVKFYVNFTISKQGVSSASVNKRPNVNPPITRRQGLELVRRKG
jgi:hypothetical protein